MFAEVVFPLPVEGPFHYRIPAHLRGRIKTGSRVVAPFGRRILGGFVVALSADRPSGEFELKDIHDVLDEEYSFSEQFLSFTKTLSAHFHVSRGEVLQAALPPASLSKVRKKVVLSPAGQERLEKKNLSPKEEALAFLLKRGAFSPRFLSKKMGVRNLSPLLSRMDAKGLIDIQTKIPRPAREKTPVFGKSETQLELDFSQERKPSLTAAIERSIKKRLSSSFYLFGSSAARQAAYARLVYATLKEGGEVLFLVPEVSLSETIMGKLRAAGVENVEVLHGRLSARKREEQWRKVVRGETTVVIGSRAALLAPLARLRLIIVDDESDESYEQQEGQLYETKIAAALRAGEEKAVLVFGDSWPSVEAYKEARMSGTLIPLGNEIRRFRTTIADDRREKTIISGTLREKLSATIRRGEQAVLFINRRGFASWTCCPKCGFSPRCRRCDIALSFHKKENVWSCHYCGFNEPASSACPVCGRGLLRRRAVGIEAVEEELKTLFPQAPTAIFDSDVSGGEKGLERLLESFRRGRISVLLGTRLLLQCADRLRAPLVGVLSPEIMLGLADYRAAQRASRFLVQASTFVTNDERAEMVIQTSNPSHFSIQSSASGDYEAFFASEIDCRRVMSYPPFTRLADVLFRGPDVRTLARASRNFAAFIKKYERDIEVLGPALPSVSKIRGIYNIQIVLKARKEEILEKALRQSLTESHLKPRLRLSW